MNNDQSYVIQHDNPIVGKCLIAARDLEAGEKILEEKPLGEDHCHTVFVTCFLKYHVKVVYFEHNAS